MFGLRKIAAGVFLAATLTSSLTVTGAAHASAKGRKNTAIALGAVAVHQLLNGKTTNAVVAGAATAAAYKRYKDEKKAEDNGRYGRRRTAKTDWFDRLTGKDKNRDRDNVRYRRDRVSRRDDRYDDERHDDDRYEDSRYDRDEDYDD